MRSVVIAGAGLAGSRCAEMLRAQGFDGRVVLVGDEPVAPYERPALSKEFLLGERRANELALRPPGFWSDHGIDLVLGRRVVSLRDGVARLDDGQELGWERFVVATGSRPRRLRMETPDGVHFLRTVADATALRAHLHPGTRLVVVGGGFVGAEAASTARRLGVRVAIVEAEESPFRRLLGRDVGAVLARRFRGAGVDLRTSAEARGFRIKTDGRASAVVLDSGIELECDVALVAVGAEPVRNLVDVAEHVYVCGDAAGGPGHWTAAAWSGGALACRLVGSDPPPAPPAYFWSDQFGLRLQLVGDPRSAREIDLQGDDQAFVARYRDGDGALVAALAANRPAEIAPLRRELALAA